MLSLWMRHVVFCFDLGTNGGVTFLGLVFSALGGSVVGLAYYVSLWLCVNGDQYESSPSQWPIIVVATVAGLLGSMVDSFLGATLQYSGEILRILFLYT